MTIRSSFLHSSQLQTQYNVKFQCSKHILNLLTPCVPLSLGENNNKQNIASPNRAGQNSFKAQQSVKELQVSLSRESGESC